MLRSAISAFTRVFDALWLAGVMRCCSGVHLFSKIGSRLCGASPNAPRPGHESNYPRANIRASCCSIGDTASLSRAAAASTESPAVSTTAEARA